MNAIVRNTSVWLWLTVPIAILLALVAGSGALFSAQIYIQGETFLVAQGAGQDIFSLFIALPGLVVSAIFVYRGSQRALLIWLGILGYLIYTYVLFAFDVHFNHLFLGYVGLFGCSLYAFIGGLVSFNSKETTAHFAEKLPVKVVSVFLVVVIVLFYSLWLGEVGKALFTGDIPQRAKDWAIPTYGVHVIDMAVFLPSLGIAAVGLWRKKSWGYIWAGVLLVLLLTLGGALVAARVSELLAGFPTQMEKLVIYGVFTLVGLGMAVGHLSGFSER